MKQLRKNYWISFLIIATIIVAYFSLEIIYSNKVYPGIKIGNIKISGLTETELENILNDKISNYEKNGITFYYQGNKITLQTKTMSLDPDLSHSLIDFNFKKTSLEAINWGRQGSLKNKIEQRLIALFKGKKINLNYNLKEPEIIKLLQENYNNLEFPAQNAKIDININEAEKQIIIKPEKLGKVINYEKALEQLKFNLNNLKYSDINLKDKTNYPDIYEKDVKNLDFEVIQILEKAPLTLSSANKQWKINENILADWLTLNKIEDEIKIDLNYEKVLNYLKIEIAPNIDKKPVKADFTIENNKVITFQIAEKGMKLMIEESIKKITQEIIQTNNKNISLVVSEIAYQTSNNLDLGIKEIIGTGHSNFAGSSASRRKNIEVGAETLNGMLIKPGQEFSLIESLGDIDAKSGYLPELVIKGNKTIPEYGGGLCQIGTTVFRTALATGLEITDRRNHSYRVSYYEPAGTDATIYDPAPDFKFINDTTDYIMIQYRIEDNDIYFDFWGTSDGRIASTTYPTIYNITPPPPTKYIETNSLAPEKIKCTERAHNGADAFFDYTVTYPETKDNLAKVKEKRFYSHYVPWQEVCLIGKKNEVSTSTEIIAENETEKIDE